MTRSDLYTILLLLFLMGCKDVESSDAELFTDDATVTILKNKVGKAIRELDFEQANTILDSFRLTIKTEKDVAGFFTWNKFKGQVNVYMNNFDSAYHYLNTSHVIAEKERDSSLLGVSKNQLSIFYTSKRQYDSAYHYAKDAYSLSSSDSTEMLTACMNLAEIYQATGHPEKQRYYLFEGFSYATTPQHITMYANEVARYYERHNYIDSAIVFYREVLSFNEYSNAIVLLYKNQTLSRLLLKNLDTTAALYHLRIALDLSLEMGNLNAPLYLLSGQIYLNRGQYTKGKAYLDSAITGYQKQENYWGIVQCHSALSNYLFNSGKFRLSAMHKDSVITYTNLIDSISKSEHLHKTESEYQLKKKQDDISGLQTLNNKNEKIKKQQSFIIGILFMVLLLLIVIGILLARRKYLSAKLQELEIEQDVLRGIMQPHFLFTSLSILQNTIRLGNKEKAMGFLQKMAKLMRLIFSYSSMKTIDLSDELLILQSFLDLNREILDNKFSYSINVYENYEEDKIKIPPLLLQPFVENAILHGISSSGHQGHIKIGIIKQGNVVEYSIDDNGIGLRSEKQLKKELHSTEVTRKRLKLLDRKNRHASALEIINKNEVEAATGVRVVIRMPVP